MRACRLPHTEAISCRNPPSPPFAKGGTGGFGRMRHWERRMGYEVQWSVLWDQPFRDWILEGLYLTCQISLIAWLFGLTIGILVGMLAESPRQSLVILSACYVEVFRN